MTAQAILCDLQALGVRLEVHGGRLRFHPRDAVGPDVLARLREHKAELLAIPAAPAAPAAATPTADPHDLQPEPIDATPDAAPRWDDLQDVATVPGCPTCGRLMTWQDGRDRVRCPSCDPPDRSRRLADRADRLRQLAAVRAAKRGTVPDAHDDAQPMRRLIGVEYPPIASPQPDPAIIAAPVTICPRCRSARLLPELRDLAGGLCWTCYAAEGVRQ